MFSDEMKKILKIETENSPVTQFEKEGGGTYNYTILPMESVASPEYFLAIREGLKEMLKDEIGESDAILSIEAKAYLVTPQLAEDSGLPHIAVRKRDYKTDDQIEIQQEKAYKGASKLYCVGLDRLRKNGFKRILLVEDMISSGLTVLKTVESLEENGFEISGIGTVYERGNGISKIKYAGHDAKSLMRLEMEKGRPFVSKFYGD